MKYAAFLITFITFGSGAAIAGSASPGNIVAQYFMSNGALLVTTDAAQTNAPACAAAANRWAIDGTTPGGKVQLSAALIAYAKGKKIAIWGRNVCSVWGDTETVDYLQVVD